jgi:glycosyltransferase involved in cell wall biosynthesis
MEGLYDDRVITLPNGIDAEMFLPANLEQMEVARTSFRLPKGAFIVVGVGRLAEVKNPQVFLEAAATFLKLHPQAVFVFAGTGPLEAGLREVAGSLGVTDSVYFLGHVSDRVELYRALDVLLITSDSEGTPMTLLEAMSCGLPVISSSVGGIPEVAKHGSNALLVPARDVQGFVSALDRVLGEEGLARKLGDNARTTIMERYEIRGLVRQIEALYEEVLGERR